MSHSPLPSLEQARVVDAYAQTALDLALAGGLVLDELGLPDTGLPASLPVTRYIDLLEQAARATGDTCFGLHVGERMRPSTFATYSHVVLSSPSFAEAVAQTQRFEGLAHDLGRTELLVEGDVAIYRWHCPWLAEHPSRHLPESVMAGIISFANWLACAPIPVFSVAFVHRADPASELAEYARIFNAPVRFGATVTEARFPASVLAIPIRNADARLFPVIERHAEQQMQQRLRETQMPPIVRAVRECLIAQLAQDRVRVSEIAAALGLPVRTLQRKLAAAGASYAQLLDAVRRELAEAYLTDPALTLTEIAFLLGFTEQSSFNHAFRDWYGCTPQHWRSNHLDKRLNTLR